MKSWNEKVDFKNLLLQDKKIMGYLKEDEINSLFDLEKIMVNINKIYKRIKLD